MDLKPDNICIGSNNVNAEESSQIFLIDFGISKGYLDDNGKHIENGPNVIF
jgi:serine/threonine protein kinase